VDRQYVRSSKAQSHGWPSPIKSDHGKESRNSALEDVHRNDPRDRTNCWEPYVFVHSSGKRIGFCQLSSEVNMVHPLMSFSLRQTCLTICTFDGMFTAGSFESD
jgi:hypothetical protein